jgi:hypothetical protein
MNDLQQGKNDPPRHIMEKQCKQSLYSFLICQEPIYFSLRLMHGLLEAVSWGLTNISNMRCFSCLVASGACSPPSRWGVVIGWYLTITCKGTVMAGFKSNNSDFKFMPGALEEPEPPEPSICSPKFVQFLLQYQLRFWAMAIQVMNTHSQFQDAGFAEATLHLCTQNTAWQQVRIRHEMSKSKCLIGAQSTGAESRHHTKRHFSHKLNMRGNRVFIVNSVFAWRVEVDLKFASKLDPWLVFVVQPRRRIRIKCHTPSATPKRHSSYREMMSEDWIGESQYLKFNYLYFLTGN